MKWPSLEKAVRREEMDQQSPGYDQTSHTLEKIAGPSVCCLRE